MPSITKILVPIDFSERSRRAIAYAVGFASHFNAELLLLHAVAPSFQIDRRAIQSEKDALRNPIAVRLAYAQRSLESLPRAEEAQNLRVRRFVQEGDIAEQILEHVRVLGPDLIIMSTRGYGPVRRFLLGSATAKVLHDAGCAVLAGRDLPEPVAGSLFRLPHVACAVQAGDHSARSMEWARWVASHFNSQLTTIHIASKSPRVCNATATFSASWHDAIELALDDIPRGLVNAIARLKADLLVVDRSGSWDATGRLTNTYTIIRDSPCPVVAV